MSDKELIMKLAKIEKLNIIGYDDRAEAEDILWCGLHGESVVEGGFEKITTVEDDPAWLYRDEYSSQTSWVFDPITSDRQAFALIKKHEIGFRMGQHANARVWFAQTKGDASSYWCANDANLNRAVVLAVIKHAENNS